MQDLSNFFHFLLSLGGEKNLVKHNPYAFANEVVLKIENIFCTPCNIYLFTYRADNYGKEY
jgi:hypothetical protein